MMLKGLSVGINRVKVSPARSSRSRYSLSVRSRLPVKTIMMMSTAVTLGSVLSSPMTASMINTLPSAAISVRQVVRMRMAVLSSQSWRIHFSR